MKGCGIFMLGVATATILVLQTMGSRSIRRFVCSSCISNIRSLQQAPVTKPGQVSANHPRRATRVHTSNKTLVIIMGSIRGGEHTWHSMYRNLLDLNHADLALAVGYDDNKNSSLYIRTNYLWEFEEYKDWGEALDLIASQDDATYSKYANTSWRAVLVDAMPDILGGYGKIMGSGAIIFWIRWFISNKLRELNLLERYDRFIVTRSDHYYLCEHNLTGLDPTKVWVPEGQTWGGITDRHVVAPSEKILQVLNITPPLLRNPIEYLKVLAELDINLKSINPERLIRHRWNMQGIKYEKFRRMMFTCAVPGDKTRWKEGDPNNRGPQGVMPKYFGEYKLSNRTCGLLE